MEENKTNINCEKPIFINIYSNLWKYWNFNIKLFTYFINLEKYVKLIDKL